MTGWTVFLAFAALVLVACLATGAWIDREARRRGSKLVSGSEMARAIKDAKREARASRSRLHLGSGAGRRSPVAPARPPWDDRRL